MCGINGIFSRNKLSDLNLRITKMNQSIAYRGPDSSNYVVKESALALGHQRLAIIDLDKRSMQPMTSNNKRYMLVFNGEIYNFKELKSDLNYEFRTTSDTEVILAYVEQYGIERFLLNSNGMFSIALYDDLKKELVLARDRMGIKPLYYYLDNDILIFSSEIKGILHSGLVEAYFNVEMIDEYLGYRYIREPYTFFRNIYQLESGCYMKIDRSLKHNKKLYWQLPQEFNSSTHYSEQDIACEFETLLTQAIKCRLVSDVPVGTYLSGGVDSSIITAIASKLMGNKPINTYTVGFPELNEFYYSEMVAKRYQTSHHNILVSSDDYFNKIDEVIGYKDAPLAVPNEIPLSIMSEWLKKDITVVLSGEGADELLGGYGRIFRSAFDYQNHKSHIGKQNFYEYFIKKYEYISRDIRNHYLNTEYPYRFEFDSDIQDMFRKHNDEENIFRFFHTYHIKGLLQRLDTTTMLASVEARVPFLDHTLLEYSYKQIPYNLKLKWKSKSFMELAKLHTADEYSEKYDIPKYLLKKISYKYLPAAVIERKKQGFPVPLNDWQVRLERKATMLLSDACWLKQDSLGGLLEESQRSDRSGQMIWMFINIELFRRKYFEKSWVY